MFNEVVFNQSLIMSKLNEITKNIKVQYSSKFILLSYNKKTQEYCKSINAKEGTIGKCSKDPLFLHNHS